MRELNKRARVLAAAGAQETHYVPRYAHLVGTCRMGFNPNDSVVDEWCRSWDVPNLFVCDGSVLPTQGSSNPALTISSLAARTADWIRDHARQGALNTRPQPKEPVRILDRTQLYLSPSTQRGSPLRSLGSWAVHSWLRPADRAAEWEQKEEPSTAQREE